MVIGYNHLVTEGTMIRSDRAGIRVQVGGSPAVPVWGCGERDKDVSVLSSFWAWPWVVGFQSAVRFANVSGYSKAQGPISEVDPGHSVDLNVVWSSPAPPQKEGPERRAL